MVIPMWWWDMCAAAGGDFRRVTSPADHPDNPVSLWQYVFRTCVESAMKTPDVVVLAPMRRRPTLDDILDKLDRAFDKAEELDLPATMVQAAMAQGKLLGMIINRVDMRQGAYPSFEGMTIDQVVGAVKNELGPDAAKALTHYVRQLERKAE